MISWKASNEVAGPKGGTYSAVSSPIDGLRSISYNASDSTRAWAVPAACTSCTGCSSGYSAIKVSLTSAATAWECSWATIAGELGGKGRNMGGCQLQGIHQGQCAEKGQAPAPNNGLQEAQPLYDLHWETFLARPAGDLRAGGLSNEWMPRHGIDHPLRAATRAPAPARRSGINSFERLGGLVQIIEGMDFKMGRKACHSGMLACAQIDLRAVL